MARGKKWEAVLLQGRRRESPESLPQGSESEIRGLLL